MLFAVATLAALAASVNAAPSLELSVGGASVVDGVDNFSVVTTLKNNGDETLKLFNDPRSPLSNFPEATFDITSAEGSSAPFLGARVKYSFKTATKFTTLAPGESVDVTHDLASAYNFTSIGAYDVQPTNLFHYQDAAGNAVPLYASLPGVHTAELKGNLVSSRLQARSGSGLHKRASFVSCSSSRQTLINSALTVVTGTYLPNAITALGTASASSARYTTWFGTYSTSNDNLVTGHYTKIKNSNPSTYTYDCSCTEDAYAYVYPSDFGYIYLCTVYWQAPTSGTDSKAGTIVHESSHFTANGGTQDYAYGQTAAKALAKSNVARAVMNADTHEYYAENTPAQS